MAIKERTEYHFADLEDFEESPAAVTPPPPPSLFERMRALIQDNKLRRIILILIGGIIVVLLITKITSFFTGKESSTPAIEAGLAPPEKKQPEISSLEAEFKMVLAENDKRHREVVDKLEKKIAEMDSKTAAMQFQLDSANHTIENLSKQLGEAPKKEVPPPAAQKEKVAVSPAKPKLPLYYIQAMVPGRAWLSSSGGSPLTVSVGDELPGYGVVSIIDINSGTVIMDQGQRITYHPNDK